MVGWYMKVKFRIWKEFIVIFFKVHSQQLPKRNADYLINIQQKPIASFIKLYSWQQDMNPLRQWFPKHLQ
jgi:hypothetical protein